MYHLLQQLLSTIYPIPVFPHLPFYIFDSNFWNLLYFFSANDKRLHNGVTNPDGNEPSVHKAQLSDYSDYDYEEDNSSKEDEEDDEDYMREVKAIIGGVLGFWGGVGGLGTMFLGNESL